VADFGAGTADNCEFGYTASSVDTDADNALCEKMIGLYNTSVSAMVTRSVAGRSTP
jgi:hypothetical protein